MEQPLHYSILNMKREISKPEFNTWRSSMNVSWEEKAFAEDASGTYHGGCIWPPRSYSCSFCKREFRSAQALGGHMDVHRRDRARLKQSYLSLENQTQSFDSNLRDEIDGVCDVVNPNSSTFGYRVSGFPVQENLSDNSKQVAELMKNQREEIYEDFVETDLLVGLNSGPCCKRPKKTGVSGFSYLIKKPRLCVKEVSTEEVVSNSMKDIDLELRLG